MFVWNCLYPFMDASSGGSVRGTLAACDQLLAIAGPRTNARDTSK